MRPAPRAPAERPGEGEWGRVVPPFDRGSILLVAAHGDGAYRCAWDEPGPRWVPAGRWRVANYRVDRTDADGVAWMISASGPNGPTVEVRDGAEAQIALDLHVRVDVRVQRRRSEVRPQITWAGENGMGLTVLRDGARSQATAEVLDADGNVLVEAPMRYG